eukprot:scaffold24529_cov140-Isochrysis_galbana.AAC.5
MWSIGHCEGGMGRSSTWYRGGIGAGGNDGASGPCRERVRGRSPAARMSQPLGLILPGSSPTSTGPNL